MVITKQDIRQQVIGCKRKMIAIRRHLHAHPELSYQEFETARYIRSLLDEWKIEHTQCTPTGTVAIIKGSKKPRHTIALRADIDALPIEEKTKLSFSSKNKGVMHACGHDVHTTCLLGAAHILEKTKKQWAGTVKLIFQPGEEKNPGGASLMMKQGVLKNPSPSAIVGLHVHPPLEAGNVAFNEGKVMASADEIHIKIKGKGGHAASPHLSEDLVHIGAQIVVGLQEIITRRKNPFIPSVLSICAFNGGHTTNVIPSEVTLKGTFRSLDEPWRKEAHQLIKEYIRSIRKKTTARIYLNIDMGYPCLHNDPALVMRVRKSAINYLSSNHVHTQAPRMGAEDFAYYAQEIPACFFRLGTGTKKDIDTGKEPSVHTPLLHINEKAIPVGIGVMAWTAIQLLNN